jgi:hypothetical protein
MNAVSTPSELRRNDNIVWFLVVLVVAAAVYCMWKGGNVVAAVGGPHGLVYIACNLH